MVFGILASAITSLVAFAFPTFASYKAIKANDISQMVPWLMLWSVQAILSFTEHWLYFLLQWVPLYRECKMFFTLWMVLPQTQGASYLYLHYVHPNLALHERDLDKLLIGLHHQIKSRGGHYVEIIVAKLYELAFGSSQNFALGAVGQANTKASSTPAPNSVSGDGYIISLFSRFRTVPFGSAPDLVPTALTSFLSTTGNHGTDIIPVNLTPEERSRYVSQQRAKLQELLHMLEAAERSYPRVDIESSQNAPSRSRVASGKTGRASGTSTPNPIDSDFEDLGGEAISGKNSNTASPRTSGGWFWKSRTD